ncbi:MAG: hypothetical protein R3Y53_11480 [Bacillota bacterium]
MLRRYISNYNHSYKFYCSYVRENQCYIDHFIDKKSSYAKRYGQTNRIVELDLEAIVFQAIKMQMELFGRKLENASMSSSEETQRSELKTLQKELSILKNKRTRSYEQYIEDKISKDMYLQKREELANQEREVSVKIVELQQESEIGREDDEEREIKELCRLHSDAEKLTYEMAHSFVDRIYVYDVERVEIIMKFTEF